MEKWTMFTANKIKPRGWLKRQLELQAQGLAGNLDNMWKDVKDSAWIGGSQEGWERVPYWLDGFIPLAYLLDREDMKARAQKYIDAILARQSPDGWICPCGEEDRSAYDLWAVFLIAKVLVGYYNATGDQRVPKALYRCLKNCYQLLRDGTVTLFKWGKWRWFECFIALNFLSEHYHEAWIIDFGRLLKKEGTDYCQSTHLWIDPLFDRTVGQTHVVNLAMQLKSEAVSCQLFGEAYTDLAESLYSILMTHNGMPVGTFTGDEHLAGLSPIHGTELCGVVELMYSFELLYAYTGDRKWAERLELVAFNALPAAISDDMWAHQYDQLSNQIACQRFPCNPIFSTNGPDAHVFGLEPHFGCCTANFGQGWPKFALNTFLFSGNTVINAIPVPAELDADNCRIILDTNYPFENRLQYTVTAKKDMTFQIRIPSFAKNLTVNGKNAQGDLSVDIAGGETVFLDVAFETTPYFEKRPYDLYTVKCGSLVFAVPIQYGKTTLEYESGGVERKHPYCDYEYFPQSDWNYAYSDTGLCLETKSVDSIPFSSQKPPVIIKANVAKIHWGFQRGHDTVCAETPRATDPISQAQEISLYPYGCAKLRMTELPLITQEGDNPFP